MKVEQNNDICWCFFKKITNERAAQLFSQPPEGEIYFARIWGIKTKKDWKIKWCVGKKEFNKKSFGVLIKNNIPLAPLVNIPPYDKNYELLEREFLIILSRRDKIKKLDQISKK